MVRDKGYIHRCKDIYFYIVILVFLFQFCKANIPHLTLTDMAFKAPSKAWQGANWPPMKGQHFKKLIQFWWHPVGQLVSCQVFCGDTPQSSEFLSEVWANSKGSLPQGQHPANQIQQNSSCRRMGGSFLLCCTERRLWKSAKIHSIAKCFVHEGSVKTR